MSRVTPLRTFVVAMLLLPGLALATPVAGPCGLCDDGMACPSMLSTGVEAEPSSCCEGDAGETQTVPVGGAMDCDCGQASPQATAAETSNAHSTFSLEAPPEDGDVSTLAVDSVGVAAVDPPTPPPPLLFLIDCTFLI